MFNAVQQKKRTCVSSHKTELTSIKSTITGCLTVVFEFSSSAWKASVISSILAVIIKIENADQLRSSNQHIKHVFFEKSICINLE